MDIGEALYHHRKKLGLTMEEMAAQIITPSYYSKVEKGIHRISAEDLFQLLSYHQIDISQFIHAINQVSHSQVFDHFQHRILQYYTNDNRPALATLKADIAQETRLNALEQSLLLAIIDVYLADLYQDPGLVSAATRHFLQEQLFSVENWDSFKLSLYTNIMDLYSLEANREMIFSILRKNLASYTSKQRMLILAILNNFIYTCIEMNEDDLARYCLTIIDQESTVYDNLAEKIYARFYRELLAYRAHPNPQHHENITHILESLTLFGLEQMSQRFRDFYDQHKNP